ncbi:MAG: Crp/Fnr family transcriptional regulator [Balneolales bacterium]
MNKRRETPLLKDHIEKHQCTIGLRLEMLGKAPFFKGLSADKLGMVNKYFNARHFETGEVIYFENDPATRLRVVVNGKIKLTRQAHEDKDVLIDILKPGEIFGTLSDLGDHTYNETAIAQTNSCVLSIISSDFRSIMNENATVAINVLDITTARLISSRENFLELSTLPVDKRIYRILCKLSEKFGEPYGNGILIQMPLTRKDLADMAGTSTETVSRIMSQLKKDDIIDTGRQWVTILNPDYIAHMDEG